MEDAKFSSVKERLRKNKDSLVDLQQQVKGAMEQELDNIIKEVFYLTDNSLLALL